MLPRRHLFVIITALFSMSGVALFGPRDRVAADNLPKQLVQYDDCLNSGADAVLVSPISEAGVANKIEEGMKKGIPQVAVANPVLKTPITAKISTDYHEKGLSAGLYVIKYLGDKGGRGGVAIFLVKQLDLAAFHGIAEAAHVGFRPA